MQEINPKYQILFTPFKVGNVEIKNRFQMAGMGGNDEISLEGACAKDAIDYYVERAKGGIGLITTGTVTILDRPKYKSIEALLTEKIDPETVVRTFGHMNERIHAYGAKVMMQLSLGTAPSQIKGVFSPSVIINDFTKEDFKYFVQRYRIISKVVKDAGFDMVEVHAVHTGYIFDQLATAASNHRTDEYGGSVANRLRLLGEIRRSIAESCGPDFPVSVKLGAKTIIYDVDTTKTGEDRVKKLLRDNVETVALAKELERLGFDMLDIDDVSPGAPYVDVRDYSWQIKNIKDAVGIPVVGSGRLYDPDISSEYIRTGICDAVSMGRQCFADPNYANKLRSNRYEDIRFCLACNQGCIARNMQELTVKCAINAVAGRETDTDFAPLRKKKKVMIVGGGPGGMEAARVAASRGHEVELYERSNALGGDFIPATVFPYSKWGRHLIGWYQRELEKLPVKIHFNTEVTAGFVRERVPDVVIIAVGASEFVLPVKGIDKPIVIHSNNYIMDDPKNRQNVVIIGGGMTGCEIALDDVRDGKNVTLVEMSDRILSARYLDTATRDVFLGLIEKEPVHVLEKTRLLEIKDAAVVLEGVDSIFEIPADVVVTAVGYRSRKTLYEQLLQEFPGEVYNVGSSNKVGNICDAIWPAYEVANGI